MATTVTLRMKLLIDKKAQRVLFAEASKEVVDFLFSLLSLPVATVVKLLGKESMVGCVSNIYASVEKLKSTYVLDWEVKDALLCRTVLSTAGSAKNPLLGLPEMTLYRCKTANYDSNCACRSYVTGVYDRECGVPVLSRHYDGGCSVSPPVEGADEGFVEGIVSYVVRDNLAVTPMSAVSDVLHCEDFSH